ncbi:hypothetical protein BCR42DRAFT_409535 [Absidia repens]|uniref:Uncharacterized protein n=1 Tax=Absidia repens TaxID=90262 RepID=A0A1X2IR93_9FUNG|nr:hypothetical protein BCR42DRAFT_409535 [Absidia repens]
MTKDMGKPFHFGCRICRMLLCQWSGVFTDLDLFKRSNCLVCTCFWYGMVTYWWAQRFLEWIGDLLVGSTFAGQSDDGFRIGCLFFLFLLGDALYIHIAASNSLV